MSDTQHASPQQAPDNERDRRNAFLLQILATAPGLRHGQLSRKLKTKGAQAIGLGNATLPDLIATHEAAGLITVTKAKRTRTYELTESGTARLANLEKVLDPVPGRGFKAPASEQVRKCRTEYLLRQVLHEGNATTSDAEANKRLDTYARESLELNASTANFLRRELVSKGLLTAQGTGPRVVYSLTSDGRLALGNAQFEDGIVFHLPGLVLNRLLEAAREVGGQFGHQPAKPPASPEELRHAILESFEELLREEHGVTRLVPIHQVREAVWKKFGSTSARHDVFDEAVLSLWRTQRLGIVPITDPSKATPEQLRDSIPGEGDTLYYLEVAHEPAPV